MSLTQSTLRPFSAALSLLATLMVFGLVSCGAKDADKIGDAQLCLDKATQGQAAACVANIKDLTSTGAYLLRCAAGFVDEGFTSTSRFNSAFQALSNKGGNSTETFLSILAFSSQSTNSANQAFVSDTYNNCIQSQAKGYMLLASMAKTATTLSGIAGTFTNGTAPSATDILNAIGSNYTDPTTQAAVGSAVIATYQSSCQTGSQANQTLCSQFDSALSSGSVNLNDPTSVGAALLTYWHNNP